MLRGWRSCCFFWDLTRYGKKGVTLFTDTRMEDTTTIPHHSGRILARPLIREILREVQLSVDEYNDYLKKL